MSRSRRPTHARFTTSIAGDRFSYDPGTVIRLSDKFGVEELPLNVAEAWLQAGILEPVEDPLETAAAVTPETASLRQTARSRRR